MDPVFWHQKWNDNQIAFHEREGNVLLAAHFKDLGLAEGARVFVPLCGKTRDIAWLLAKGCRVAGAELSRLAVEQLFEELGVEPEITTQGALTRFAAPDLDIFVGDIFDLTQATLGPVDAVYDRAAFVALPETMRGDYSRHMAEITATAPQLLITFEYDQAVMPGPPFSIPTGEVHGLHEPRYGITALASVDVAGGLKGRCKADENVWLLQPSGAG
ncbi:MAG: thiopurine S-methyltransferase [Alphaproteobacteria bacterium]|nr:thiopurine S-methyltransferase [Alphaproteobacteria bacterium]